MTFFFKDMGNQKGIVKEVEKVWLSIKETQNYLDCSRDYIYRLISEGKIRAARDGKMTFVKKDTLDKYLSSLVVTL